MKNLRMIVAYLCALGMMIFIVDVLSGCSTSGYTRHPWTAKECRQAGGLLMCEGNWGRCECVDAERARQAIGRLP